MSSTVFKSDLMFGELLAYLRQHGFHIGVDHYLRLQQLLERVGSFCAPNELRTLLCPIFATNKTQQEQFYRAFDSYFDFFQSEDEIEETTYEATPETQTLAQALTRKSSRRKWLYVAAPVALAALVVALVLIFRQKPAEQSVTSSANTNARPEVAATTETAKTEETRSEVTGTTQPSQTEEQASVTPTPPVPMPSPIPEQGFYERNRTVINLSIILAPLLLFLLYEWYRFARRKLLIQKQQARKPPFIWPLHVDAPRDSLYDSEQLLTAARLMRRRQVDEFRRLDVEATVSATIERLGFPDFRYKADSRVPEYLVLIDRASFRDHQARAFDELTKALEREGVFVVRYFFDNDPRVCRDETGAGVVQLTELQNKLGGHRLLIFSGGAQLLDPITGKLEGWTAIFNHWQDRAILTVESPARWGLKEIALAQSFIVLPATLDGLLALVDLFETTVPATSLTRSRGRFETSLTGATPEEAIAELRSILGEDAFQWLAACAVYTELQWNLTLFLGSLPSMPRGLLTEANLLKLIRLPWFRTGAIPDELRWHLINELAPERQRSVRAALVELLEKDPAPPETFAADQYHLNLFAQRWLQSQTRKRLRELMDVIKKLPRSQVVRDLTLIRFLESSKRSPLDFLLPDRLRKTFYHRGVPAFGLKTGARFLFTLVLVGVAWIGIRAVTSRTSNAEPPDLAARNFGVSPTPPSINLGTAQNSVPMPETLPLPPVGNDAPAANQSPVSSPATNTPPPPASPAEDERGQTTAATNSDPNQKQGTLVSSGTKSGVTSIPPIGGEQPSSTPQPNESTKEVDALTAANKYVTEASQLTAQNKYSEALAKYSEALSIYRKISSPQREAIILNNIGTINVEIGNFNIALQYYQQSLALKQRISDRAGQIVVLNNIGKVYERMGAQAKALEFYNEAKKLQALDRPSSRAEESPMTKSTPAPTPPVVSIVSGGVLNGKAISLPRPLYPAAAKEAGASGTVIVSVLVDESGKVISAKAIKGHPLLQQPAIQAALKARFPQTIASGQPVKLQGVLNYSFKLMDAGDRQMQPPQPNMPGRRPPGGGRPPEEK